MSFASDTILEEAESSGRQGNAYCPCCGSLVDSRDVMLDTEQGVVSLRGKVARLSRTQTLLLTVLLRAWPRTASMDAMIFGAYEGRDQPETAYNVICNTVTTLREAVRPLGLSVRYCQGVGYKLNIPEFASVNKLSVNRRAA